VHVCVHVMGWVPGYGGERRRSFPLAAGCYWMLLECRVRGFLDRGTKSRFSVSD